MFGLMMCEDRVSMQPRYRQIVDGLRQLPSEEIMDCMCITVVVFSLGAIEEVLKMDGAIKQLASTLYQQKSLIIMGRGFNYATCLEGALVSNYGIQTAALYHCCVRVAVCRKSKS